MRKLCIRSLQRGVGSMDFMQGLLIMQDDLDEGHEEDESDVTPTPSTSTDLACSSNAGTPDPAPSPSNNAIPWCKCGVCQIMPQELWFTTLCYNAHSIFKALLGSRCYTVGHKEHGGYPK